jgi:hypothetical protein
MRKQREGEYEITRNEETEEARFKSLGTNKFHISHFYLSLNTVTCHYLGLRAISHLDVAHAPGYIRKLPD